MTAMDVGGVGEADRAGEVAGLIDFDDREAAVLLMIGAKAAVEGTAGLGTGLRGQRPVAGLQPVLLLAPIIKVVADQRFLDAMSRQRFRYQTQSDSMMTLAGTGSRQVSQRLVVWLWKTYGAALRSNGSGDGGSAVRASALPPRNSIDEQP